MEGDITVVVDNVRINSSQFSELLENLSTINNNLVDINTKLQYQANQFHVLLVGLLLVLVVYMMYRIVKNFY